MWNWDEVCINYFDYSFFVVNRVVPDGQGSFAMGFQQVVLRVVGLIPAPMVFGHVIDKSCMVWIYDKCSATTANCREYDNATFRFILIWNFHNSGYCDLSLHISNFPWFNILCNELLIFLLFWKRMDNVFKMTSQIFYKKVPFRSVQNPPSSLTTKMYASVRFSNYQNFVRNIFWDNPVSISWVS